MKISLITATIDPDTVLRATLESVERQTHPDVEHLVIDGFEGSRDPDIFSDFPKARFIRSGRNGVYAALNEGTSAATGDVIGLIHGNDRLAHPGVLAHVADAFSGDQRPDFIYGDLIYFNPRTGKRGPVYSSENFRPEHLKSLVTPPHPTLYMSRDTARRVGNYSSDYKISGDLDMWLRMFSLPEVRWLYLPEIMVEMSTGGISQQLINILWHANIEKLRIMKANGIDGSVFTLLKKYVHALRRYI
ncbi:MAG: glycosyltransferase [Muribaculaceae bacterium]|nr:glycosyltransferase [Muribaculaceae bacterium]